jgi:hypothetical protein
MTVSIDGKTVKMKTVKTAKQQNASYPLSIFAKKNANSI